MEKNDNKEGNVVAGFVLYNTDDVDISGFIQMMKDEWDIDVINEVSDGSIVFNYDNMTVACTAMKMPVPDKEAENAAKYNILWKDGEKAVAEHKSHVILAVVNKYDPIKQAVLFAKAAYCLLKIDGAIGIYKDPTAYEKDFYINFAETIKDDELPMPILIYAGLYLASTGICAFTSGLRFFGKEEIEIIDSGKTPDEVVGFLYSIAEYVVSEDVTLQDGETIGFTEEQKLPITVSKGVSVNGDSIKIKF